MIQNYLPYSSNHCIYQSHKNIIQPEAKLLGYFEHELRRIPVQFDNPFGGGKMRAHIHEKPQLENKSENFFVGLQISIEVGQVWSILIEFYISYLGLVIFMDFIFW